MRPAEESGRQNGTGVQAQALLQVSTRIMNHVQVLGVKDGAKPREHGMPCWEAADLLAGVGSKVDPRGPPTVPNPSALPCSLTRAEAGPSQVRSSTGHEAGRQGCLLSAQKAVTSCDGILACKHSVSDKDRILGGGRPPTVPNPSAFPCSLTRAEAAPSQVRSSSGHEAGRQEGLLSAQKAVASRDGIAACKHSASDKDRSREGRLLA